MRKFFGFGLSAAAVLLLAVPASATLWNIDFDNGLNASGEEISFAPNTIFSHPTQDGTHQRYDGIGDGGIPGTNGVTVEIDVYNASKRRYNGTWNHYGGGPGHAVGFDTNNTNSRDPDLQRFRNGQQQHPGNESFNNILIIQSHEDYDTRTCGGGLGTTAGVCGPDSSGRNSADDEAKGGDIVFEFNREVRLVKMNYFDIEYRENNPKAKVKAWDEDDNLVLNKYILPTVPDGGVGLLTFNGDIGIEAQKFMVWLPSSGGIDNLMGDVITTTSVTEPGVLALFGAGLLGIGAYRRRRMNA